MLSNFFSRLFIVAVCMCPLTANAEPTSYTTQFSFEMKLGGSTTLLNSNFDRELLVSMPAGFAPWSCKRTGVIVSDDRSNNIVTLACSNDNWTSAVWMPIICATSSVDTDYSRMNLSGKSGSILFVGKCATRSSVQSKPVKSGPIEHNL